MTDYEFHSPAAGSEYSPPGAEFAPLPPEFGSSGGSGDRRAQQTLRSRARLRARRTAAALLTVLAAAAVLSGGLSGASRPAPSSGPGASTTPVSTPVQTDQPSPVTPAVQQALPYLTFAEAAALYPDWYDAEHGAYLHFGDGVGWFADETYIHRFTWAVTDEAHAQSTLAFADVAAGYEELGSTMDPVELPMALFCEPETYRIEAVSGLAGGYRTASAESGVVVLASRADSFVPVAADGALDVSAVDALASLTTYDLLAGAELEVTELVASPFGDIGSRDVHVQAAGLILEPDGTGSLVYEDNSGGAITWEVLGGDYGAWLRIRYSDITVGSTTLYSGMLTAELTLTTSGPRLWLYNWFGDAETCFACDFAAENQSITVSGTLCSLSTVEDDTANRALVLLLSSPVMLRTDEGFVRLKEVGFGWQRDSQAFEYYSSVIEPLWLEVDRNVLSLSPGYHLRSVVPVTATGRFFMRSASADYSDDLIYFQKDVWYDFSAESIEGSE